MYNLVQILDVRTLGIEVSLMLHIHPEVALESGSGTVVFSHFLSQYLRQELKLLLLYISMASFSQGVDYL